MMANVSKLTGKKLFWIAINGSSCSFSGVAMVWPFTVIPTPEILVGFKTEEEAYEAQQECLTCDASLLPKLVADWQSKDDCFIVKVKNPQKQTDGQTAWINEPIS